ncbi:hypothetical protein D3C72_2480330 [compost metagenome]
MLDAQEDAAQVDAKHPVEILHRVFLHPVGAAGNAGIVEGGIETTTLAFDMGE